MLLFGALLLAVNVVLYRHAYAMTHLYAHRCHRPVQSTFWERLRLVWNGPTLPRPVNRATPGDYGLAYENHEFAGEMGRLSAWHIPHRRRRGMVLLFHGYLGCKAHVLAEGGGVSRTGLRLLPD